MMTPHLTQSDSMMNTSIKSYRDERVWQKAMLLVNKIYKVSVNFPETEKYVLTSQLRSSAISIPSYLAEGYGRAAANDYIRTLNVTMGALYELQTQLEIALNQDYMNKEIFDLIYEDSREIDRMINHLIRTLSL